MKWQAKFLICILSILSLESVAQDKATSPAYYIDALNDTIVGYVINNEWKNTPQLFEFRELNSNRFDVLKLSDFNLLVVDKRRRFRSTQVLDGDAQKWAQDLEYETSLKELIVEDLVIGYYNLYILRSGSESRYYFSQGKDTIRSLDYYRELNIATDSYTNHHLYRNQLWQVARCPTTTLREINKLNYNSKSLINYFINLNNCYEDGYVNYEKLRRERRKRSEFRFTVGSGLNYSRFKLENGFTPERNTKYGSFLDARIGAEIEFLLPYNNYQFAILMEANYNSYSDVKDVYLIENKTMQVTVDFKFLEIPVGVRYYLNNANSDSELKYNYFVNALAVSGFHLGGKIVSERREIFDSEYGFNVTFGAGVGLLCKSKLALELRGTLPVDVLNQSVSWKGIYHKNSLLIGYRF